MKLKEIDLMGKQTASFDAIRAKHDISYKDLVVQLAKGIKIEKEHTGNIALAREIALDHLTELPDYYDMLEKAGQKN
jgi:Protein of unknown function (DUF5661)